MADPDHHSDPLRLRRLWKQLRLREQQQQQLLLLSALDPPVKMGRTASLFTRRRAGQASAQQGFDARIDLLMDVLDAAHPTIPCAVDALPAAARGDTARVLAALAQIGVIRLMDIGGV